MMNKIIDETLCEEYEGLIRTTYLSFEGKVTIEYNLQFSNEIGHQFAKDFFSNREILQFTAKLQNKKKHSASNESDLGKIARESNQRIMKNILDGNLPPLLDGFVYLGDTKDLKELYELILSLE